MQMKLLGAAAVMLVAAWPSLAAQPGLGNVIALRRACGADINSLCAGVDRGNGATAQCMMAHADSLSPNCTEALQALRASSSSGDTSGLYDKD